MDTYFPNRCWMDNHLHTRWLQGRVLTGLTLNSQGLGIPSGISLAFLYNYLWSRWPLAEAGSRAEAPPDTAGTATANKIYGPELKAGAIDSPKLLVELHGSWTRLLRIFSPLIFKLLFWKATIQILVRH